MADNKSSSGMPLPDALAGNFQEAVRWFNQMWGSGGDAVSRASGPIPSVLMPTFDIQELDKRIADLRSVEHWLQLNQGLLQSTIQGLEMQRNTVAAWQSFGAATAGAVASATAGKATAATEPPAAGPAATPPFEPAMWWASLQQQFAQMAAAAAAGEAAPGTPAGKSTTHGGDATAAGAASGRSSAGRSSGRTRSGGSGAD